ncbi:MAG: hypothetical protein FWD35_05840 [Oscillospiraceae bacterium]|nr:hypothetical protein [Oscillospiraceae bacterium]
MPLHGNDIREYLRGCEAVKISAITLGAEFDREFRRLQLTDMAAALELDTTANKLLCSTDSGNKSFSPGYGDFPLSVNRDIIEALQADKKIGLCALESGMMTPQKSVTRITAIDSYIKELSL